LIETSSNEHKILRLTKRKWRTSHIKVEKIYVSKSVENMNMIVPRSWMNIILKNLFIICCANFKGATRTSQVVLRITINIQNSKDIG